MASLPPAADAKMMQAELDRLKANIDALWERYDAAIGKEDRGALVDLSAALTDLELERSDLRLALESLRVNSPRWDALLATLRAVNEDLETGLKKLKQAARLVDLAAKGAKAIKGVVGALL
jgi:predicted  nucleic acid-binding Zn-ribbon protein